MAIPLRHRIVWLLFLGTLLVVVELGTRYDFMAAVRIGPHPLVLVNRGLSVSIFYASIGTFSGRYFFHVEPGSAGGAGRYNDQILNIGGFAIAYRSGSPPFMAVVIPSWLWLIPSATVAAVLLRRRWDLKPRGGLLPKTSTT